MALCLMLPAEGGGGDALKEGQPVALEWWCRDEDDEDGNLEDGLVLVRNTGALAISSSVNFSNLLGENSEFLAQSSMVSWRSYLRQRCLAEAAWWLSYNGYFVPMFIIYCYVFLGSYNYCFDMRER